MFEYKVIEIVENGELVDSWPCDVNEDGDYQSNGSQEFLYNYKGAQYLIQMDWDNKPIHPDEVVEPISFNM